MNANTTDRGLDRLTCTALTGDACDPPAHVGGSNPSSVNVWLRSRGAGFWGREVIGSLLWRDTQ